MFLISLGVSIWCIVRWSWRRGKAGTRHEERAAGLHTLVVVLLMLSAALLLHLRGDVDRCRQAVR